MRSMYRVDMYKHLLMIRQNALLACCTVNAVRAGKDARTFIKESEFSLINQRVTRNE